MMTTREKLIYLFWVLMMWFFAYWKQLLIGVALVVIVWLLSGCVVGIAPTATPTPAPTPTMETGCVPNSYAALYEDAILYTDASLLIAASVVTASNGDTSHFETAIIQAGESVLLLYDRTDNEWRVTAAA